MGLAMKLDKLPKAKPEQLGAASPAAPAAAPAPAAGPANSSAAGKVFEVTHYW
jgi:hypothetical protein